MKTLPTYVLITPARNEAAFIESTIKSVVSQTVLPLKWIIVSDGSTDETDAIALKYAAKYPWIEFLRMPEREERHFAGKVLAFNAGYAKLRPMTFTAVGCLDADISFDSGYFEFLLGRLADDPALGLVGTRFRTPSNFSYNYRFVNIEHVTGCCQLFWRACFEQIGGYVAAKGGAIDWIANIACRMYGWKTRTFLEKEYLHHREFGTAGAGLVKSRFKDGAKAYAVGCHPAWMLFRIVYQMTKMPLLIGGLALLWGYLWSAIRRVPRPVSREFVNFHRSEQKRRLKGLYLRAYGKRTS